MASYIKLIHNGIMKTVALYEGIEQGEFTSLLSTVFNINGSIVGVMGEVSLYFLFFVRNKSLPFRYNTHLFSERIGCSFISSMQGSAGCSRLSL